MTINARNLVWTAKAGEHAVFVEGDKGGLASKIASKKKVRTDKTNKHILLLSISIYKSIILYID